MGKLEFLFLAATGLTVLMIILRTALKKEDRRQDDDEHTHW